MLHWPFDQASLNDIVALISSAGSCQFRKELCLAIFSHPGVIQVAELTENALLQLEILRHASRVLSWQICSPDTMAQILVHAWPAFPDLLGTLKAMAAMSAT